MNVHPNLLVTMAIWYTGLAFVASIMTANLMLGGGGHVDPK